jgi:Leucine-rich repeat (LRR) protein
MSTNINLNCSIPGLERVAHKAATLVCQRNPEGALSAIGPCCSPEQMQTIQAIIQTFDPSKGSVEQLQADIAHELHQSTSFIAGFTLELRDHIAQALNHNMPIEQVLLELSAIKNRLAQNLALSVEEMRKLQNIFRRIAADSSLPRENQEAILSLKDRVIQTPKTHELQTIFLLLLRSCPDETIADFLGLNTWESEGNTAEAKRRIIACVQNMGDELDLRMLELTSLPVGIGQLMQLKTLNCSHNKLIELPKEIELLTQLIKLDCSSNRLTSLPAEIGQLIQLTILNCSANYQLSSLPVEIGQLTQLITLDCSHSKLTSLPAQIRQLAQLQELFCTSNQLTSLPAEIGQLAQLTILDCSHNKLTSLPAQIRQLTQLTTLNCSSNYQLSSLPAVIGQLTKLQILHCSENNLTSLPAWIKQLTKLTTLNCSNNRLSSLPAEIGQLTQLTTLDCSRNPLTSLPAVIKQLTQLSTLDCSHNKFISLPAEIGQLTQLSTLNCSYNKLSSLPAAIGQLTQLTTLDCSYNKLSSLPAVIVQLTQLSTLDCSHNDLTSLPAVIGQLTQLTTLDCSYNKLSSLPAVIVQLTQLSILNCSHNDLTSLPAEIKQLIRLTQLDCSVNHLISLPAEIGQLTQLTCLKCFANRLTSIPAEVGQLTRLTHLSCSNNHLTSLPAEIGQLMQLNHLSCSNNQLTSLPAEIGQLMQLQQLYCDCNQLISLPAEIGQLMQLQYLRCEHNQLTSLPVGIGQLTQLGALDCFDNHFTSLPRALASLNSDTRIDFSENQISTLPMELSHLNIDLGGQRFNRTSNTATTTISFESFKQVVASEQKDLKNLQIPILQQSECWPNVSLWLDKLKGSNDFTNLNTCSLTVERVLSILKLAEENEGYRNALSAILTQALQTCVDRATLCLNPLEIQKAIIEAKAGSLEQMLQVLKGAFAAEILELYALLFVKHHPDPAVRREALEVHLAFQLKLKKEFTLPIGVTNMNYEFCARLTKADIEKAKAHVHQALQNQEKFIEFVTQQDAWAEKLSSDFAEEKASTLAPMHAASEELEEKLFAVPRVISDQEYKSQIEGLTIKFNQVTKAWLKAKTQALCLQLAATTAPMETVITIKCQELPCSKNLFIRGDSGGLNWNKGIKLTRIDWDTFQVKLCTPFQGVLKYKLLIDDVLWEGGDNHEVRPGEKVTCVHTFEKTSLPKTTKTVLKLECAVPAGKTLFVLGDGPLGNWDRKVPMLPVQGKKNSWFVVFDGNFADFKYKLRLGDAWEQGENRTARCGQIIAMKSIRF